MRVLRAREAAPDVAPGEPSLLVFELDDVLQRVAERGDLFADVLTSEQRLPGD